MDNQPSYRRSELRDRDRAQRTSAMISYPVNAIIDHQFRTGQILYYLLKWSPIGRYEDSWEPSCNLSCDRLIIEYWQRRALVQYLRELHELNIGISMTE